MLIDEREAIGGQNSAMIRKIFDFEFGHETEKGIHDFKPDLRVNGFEKCRGLSEFRDYPECTGRGVVSQPVRQLDEFRLVEAIEEEVGRDQIVGLHGKVDAPRITLQDSHSQGIGVREPVIDPSPC